LKKTLRKQQGKLSNDQYRQLREVFDQAVG
jgi:hypothetical protein